MRTLRDFFLPAALALALVPVARAADDEKTASDKKGEEQTIRGVVAEVTILGETDVDFATRKAVTAEATFVTVIGHPAHHEATHRDGDRARENASANRGNETSKDRDVNRTANASNEQPKAGQDGRRSAEHARHRMNVYIVAVSPKTEVCESQEAGKAGSAKEEKCSLDKLEIGDRVEVRFSPKTMASASGEKAQTHPANQKHGRHRTVFGTANAIKIMAEPMEGEHSGSSSSERDAKK